MLSLICSQQTVSVVWYVGKFVVCQLLSATLRKQSGNAVRGGGAGDDGKYRSKEQKTTARNAGVEPFSSIHTIRSVFSLWKICFFIVFSTFSCLVLVVNFICFLTRLNGTPKKAGVLGLKKKQTTDRSRFSKSSDERLIRMENTYLKWRVRRSETDEQLHHTWSQTAEYKLLGKLASRHTRHVLGYRLRKKEKQRTLHLLVAVKLLKM